MAMESRIGSPIKRREMGVAGALIVLSQLASSLQSSNQITDQIRSLKEDFQQSQIDREKYFVRKSELKAVIVKLDQMSDQLSRLHEQIKSIQKDYASFSQEGYLESDLIGCSYSPGKSIYKGVASNDARRISSCL